MSSSAETRVPADGRFITLEGGEGAGKSTQVRMLVDRLAAAGVEALATREPGGTPLAEAYRTALLDGAVAAFGPAAEAICFSAARIDHLDRRIAPALQAGRAVVCDRFVDSTRAYQGVLGDLDPALITALERVAVGKCMPDLTVILDIPAEMGMDRAASRRIGDGAPDRFERQGISFHEGLRQAFRDIAKRNPDRCSIVDASRSTGEVAEAIWTIVVTRVYPWLADRSGGTTPDAIR